jgi:hypothetical protein
VSVKTKYNIATNKKKQMKKNCAKIHWKNKQFYQVFVSANRPRRIISQWISKKGWISSQISDKFLNYSLQPDSLCVLLLLSFQMALTLKSEKYRMGNILEMSSHEIFLKCLFLFRNQKTCYTFFECMNCV